MKTTFICFNRSTAIQLIKQNFILKKLSLSAVVLSEERMAKEKKNVFFCMLGKQQLVLTMMVMIITTNKKMKREKKGLYVHVCIFILRLIKRTKRE